MIFGFATRAGSPQQYTPITVHIYYFFIQLTHRSMVTTTVRANYCGPVLPIPPGQLSLWEETGVPRENPRLSAER